MLNHLAIYKPLQLGSKGAHYLLHCLCDKAFADMYFQRIVMEASTKIFQRKAGKPGNVWKGQESASGQMVSKVKG